MKQINKLALVIAIICIYSLPHLAKAQENNHANNGNGNGNGNNGNGYGNGGSASVPIDGGLSILAIAGVAYAAKKAMDLKNNKTIK